MPARRGNNSKVVSDLKTVQGACCFKVICMLTALDVAQLLDTGPKFRTQHGRI